MAEAAPECRKRTATEFEAEWVWEVWGRVLAPDEEEKLCDQMGRLRTKRVCLNAHHVAVTRARLREMSQATQMVRHRLRRVKKVTPSAWLDRWQPPDRWGAVLRQPFSLYRYQHDTIEWLLRVERGDVPHPSWPSDQHGGMLAMKMGLGKTIIMAVLVVHTLAEQRATGSPTLFICPRNVFATLRFEFEKFLGSHLRVLIWHRDFMGAKFAQLGPHDLRAHDVVITNYETIVGCMKRAGEIPPDERDTAVAQWLWYRIVVDESHEIRSRTTQRHRALCALVASRRWAMTGTPVHNGMMDVIGQLEFTGFRPTGDIRRMTPAIFGRLGLEPRIRRVEYEDAHDVVLPPMHEERIMIDISPREREIHERFMTIMNRVRDSMARVFGREKQALGSFANAQLTRLLLLCAAPVLGIPLTKMTQELQASANHAQWQTLMTFLNADLSDIEMAGETGGIQRQLQDELSSVHVDWAWLANTQGDAGIGSSKMRALSDWILRRLDQGDDKIVVYDMHTSVLHLLIQAIVSQRPSFASQHVFIHGETPLVARDEMYDRFRAEAGIRVLFNTLKLATGLNLTEANVVLFAQPWYSYGCMQQAITRLHRIGQTRPVSVIFPVIRDSSEERVLNIAMDKKDIINSSVFAPREQRTAKAAMVWSVLPPGLHPGSDALPSGHLPSGLPPGLPGAPAAEPHPLPTA